MRPQRPWRERLHVQSFKGAGLIGFQQPVASLRKGQPLRAGAGSDQASRAPESGAPGDVGFLVRVEQFLGEHGGRVRRCGIQIDHPRLQVRRFPRSHLAHAPQQRAGQFTVALTLQHLRAAGHEPDALFRRRVGIDQTLQQRQRTGRGPPGVRRHFAGGGPRSVPRHGRHVHDAVQRNVGRQIRYQRSPRLAIFRVQRLRHDA